RAALSQRGPRGLARAQCRPVRLALGRWHSPATRRCRHIRRTSRAAGDRTPGSRVMRRQACLLIVAAIGVFPTSFPQVLTSSNSVETVADRVGARKFPSAFQSWNAADNLPNESPLETAARHDLLWNVPEYFGMKWDSQYRLLGTSFQHDTVAAGLEVRASLLERNPNMVLLGEVRWHDGTANELPDSSAWWQRDATGQRMIGWAEGNQLLLDWHNADFRA